MMKRIIPYITHVMIVVIVVFGVPVAGTPAPHLTSTLTAINPPPLNLAGLDAHDGTILKSGGTYYLYGTRYGCGYQWQNAASPFCGFGSWTAPALAGPWTFAGLLFDPAGTNSTRNEPWHTTCNMGGNGCFNPRMIQRPDGVWILFFNAPADTTRGDHTNAYYVMGCNGPTGPCGSAAGAPHGSTRQVPLNACNMSGDFTVVADGSTAYLVCSGGTISIEQLDVWWTSGVATASSGAVRSIAYLTGVESPGIFKAPDGMWVLTYSDPQCGYCAGTPTGYAVAQASLTDPSPASSPLGVWLPPINVGWSAPAGGRRDLSGTSCGGQPRTVFTVDNQAWQWVDLWVGAANETSAGVHLEPLTSTGQSWRAPADGTVWRGGLSPFLCS